MMDIAYYISIGFLFGLAIGLMFGGRSTMKGNEKPKPTMPKYKSAPPPPRAKAYQPNVDNTTNPPLRDTNTYIENGMPKFPEDIITKHQEG